MKPTRRDVVRLVLTVVVILFLLALAGPMVGAQEPSELGETTPEGPLVSVPGEAVVLEGPEVPGVGAHEGTPPLPEGEDGFYPILDDLTCDGFVDSGGGVPGPLAPISGAFDFIEDAAGVKYLACLNQWPDEVRVLSSEASLAFITVLVRWVSDVLDSVLRLDISVYLTEIVGAQMVNMATSVGPLASTLLIGGGALVYPIWLFVFGRPALAGSEFVKIMATIALWGYIMRDPAGFYSGLVNIQSGLTTGALSGLDTYGQGGTANLDEALLRPVWETSVFGENLTGACKSAGDAIVTSGGNISPADAAQGLADAGCSSALEGIGEYSFGRTFEILLYGVVAIIPLFTIVALALFLGTAQVVLGLVVSLAPLALVANVFPWTRQIARGLMGTAMASLVGAPVFAFGLVFTVSVLTTIMGANLPVGVNGFVAICFMLAGYPIAKGLMAGSRSAAYAAVGSRPSALAPVGGPGARARVQGGVRSGTNAVLGVAAPVAALAAVNPQVRRAITRGSGSEKRVVRGAAKTVAAAGTAKGGKKIPTHKGNPNKKGTGTEGSRPETRLDEVDRNLAAKAAAKNGTPPPPKAGARPTTPPVEWDKPREPGKPSMDLSGRRPWPQRLAPKLEAAPPTAMGALPAGPVKARPHAGPEPEVRPQGAPVRGELENVRPHGDTPKPTMTPIERSDVRGELEAELPDSGRVAPVADVPAGPAWPARAEKVDPANGTARPFRREPIKPDQIIDPPKPSRADLGRDLLVQGPDGVKPLPRRRLEPEQPTPPPAPPRDVREPSPEGSARAAEVTRTPPAQKPTEKTDWPDGLNQDQALSLHEARRRRRERRGQNPFGEPQSGGDGNG